MEGSYNAGVASTRDSTGRDDYDDRPSSSKAHRHSSHNNHRHSSHSNKDGHHRRHSNHSHRHSNHGHGHRHHHSHQHESHKVPLNTSGVAPSPAHAYNNQGRAEQQQQSSHRPSSGLAQSTPPEATMIAQSNKETLAKSAPPYSHPIDIDAIAYSSEEGDEEPRIKQSSNAIDKAARAVPVVAVQPTSTTTMTVINPAATTSSSDSIVEPRQGQKCCGCCCDYRRAVLIINIVIIILEIAVIILVATGFLGYYLYGDNTGSNALAKYETAEMIFSAVSIVLSGIAIGGAILFNIWMVGLNIVWLVVGFVLAIILGLQYCGDYCDYYESLSSEYYDYYCTCIVSFPAVAFAFAFMVLWIYPHVGFIIQVKKGIMSRDTYAREQFSCCCV